MKKLITILFLLLAPSAYAVTTEDLISFWKMDETSGTRYDAHSSNDLTDNNTVDYGTGKISNGADFEWNNSEYLSHADNDDFSLGSDQDFTISLWVNFESLSGYNYRPLFCKGESDTKNREYCVYYYYIGLNPNNKMRLQVGNGTTYLQIEQTFDSSATFTWFHIVAWHDSSANKLYLQINGATPTEGAWSGGTYAGGTGALEIGRFGFSTSHLLDGIVDEVGFWKRVLTADERAELYNSGNGLSYDDFTEPGGGGGYAHSQGYVIG